MVGWSQVVVVGLELLASLLHLLGWQVTRQGHNLTISLDTEGEAVVGRVSRGCQTDRVTTGRGDNRVGARPSPHRHCRGLGSGAGRLPGTTSPASLPNSTLTRPLRSNIQKLGSPTTYSAKKEQRRNDPVASRKTGRTPLKIILRENI